MKAAAKQISFRNLGHSKEKRTDRPLVTLALMLDSSGFPKCSRVFEGNVSEPVTLKKNEYPDIVVSRKRHRQFNEYDNVLKKIGRLRQQYSKAAKHYKIEVSKDEKTATAIKILWIRQPAPATKEGLPGVYCLKYPA